MRNPKACKECGKPLGWNRKGDFCAPACKSAYHNRRAKLGALALDVLLLHRKYPDRTANFPERLELLLAKIEADEKTAGRSSTSRTLRDVLYDAELPRTDVVVDFI